VVSPHRDIQADAERVLPDGNGMLPLLVKSGVQSPEQNVRE